MSPYCEFGDIISWRHLFVNTLNVLAANVSKRLRLKRDANVDSMVVKLTHSGNSMLFTGDAEGTTWEYIKNKNSNALMASVLILSHHGAIRNDCTFPRKATKKGSTIPGLLDLIQPKICLISAGFRYNHPNKSVIDICRDYYKGNNFRTAPHFISYCIGSTIFTYHTNLPIFTTMDSGSIAINLTKLTVSTSRGLSTSSPIVFQTTDYKNIILKPSSEDKGITEEKIRHVYKIRNSTDIEKYIIDSDNDIIGETYVFNKSGKNFHYYKVGNIFYLQNLVIERSSESIDEPVSESEAEINSNDSEEEVS